ncbi:MAG: DUF177 domain-containing protein [Christensenella sp.]
MIDIDVREALQNEGVSANFAYEGFPEMDVLFVKPLVLNAEYCATNRKVSVKGTFEAVLSTVCDRCLADMQTTIHEKFDEIFVFGGEGVQDDEVYTYTGGSVSLDKPVHDAIYLSLPQQLLCKDDCKGLCPQCGQNLNDKKCECKQENTDDMNPFTKLKGLF